MTDTQTVTDTQTTSRPRDNRRGGRATAVLVALLVGALAVLTGCTSNSVAAYVDGRPVLNVSDLDEMTAAFEGTGVQATREGIVTVVVYKHIADTAAAEHGIELSAEVRDQIAAEVGEQPNETVRQLLVAQSEAGALFEALENQQAGLADRVLSNAQVEVNPRYGAWVSSTEGYGVIVPDALAQPPADAVNG